MAKTRWLSAGLFAISLLFTLLFAAALAGDLYGRLSAEQRARGQSNVAVISTAGHAVNLQPWRVGFRTDLAWTLGVRGDVHSMRAQYRHVLRSNPGSGYLWLEYAQALARAHRIDSEYTLALERASVLSHNAGPVQMMGARMGVNHWGQGGEADRAIWARNMTYALRTSPGEFLWHVLRARREAAFCGYVGVELGWGRWCTAVVVARGLCDSLRPGAKGAAADQCASLGLIPPKDDGTDGR